MPAANPAAGNNTPIPVTLLVQYPPQTDPPQSCPVCHRVPMVNARQIRAHASRIHRGASVHWSFKIFKGVWTAIKSKAAYRRHCTGSTTSQSGLSTLDPKYSCPDCDRAFSTLGGLQLHRRRRHPSAYNESLPRPTGRNRPWGDDELRR